MDLVRRLLLVSSLAIGLMAGGLTATDTVAQQATSVQISEQNGSGVQGTATLTPMGSQTQVVVQLQNAPGPHPIHIHEGSCANLNPAPKFPVTTVQNGRSETMVSASVQDIMAAAHSINVHKSPQEASVYVACGGVRAAAQARPASQQMAGQQPGTLPRSGEAENRAIGALAVIGAALLGTGLVARRRAS